MLLHIEETKNKLAQLAHAPKRLKGNPDQKRLILKRWCDRAGITPVYEMRGDPAY